MVEELQYAVACIVVLLIVLVGFKLGEDVLHREDDESREDDVS